VELLSLRQTALSSKKLITNRILILDFKKKHVRSKSIKTKRTFCFTYYENKKPSLALIEVASPDIENKAFSAMILLIGNK
jgi:hypothetical protein